ncbi:hypothetical protein [Streptomyces sp. NPDC048172]|uniref:hypothetical protein n=1 Tax=Streptomyces sp. NPDC048172 TaxID=3365505 RepID=UPI00371FCB0F
MTELADRAQENGPHGTRAVPLRRDEERHPRLPGRYADPAVPAATPPLTRIALAERSPE